MSTELDQRQQFILQAVVMDYVRTAEPVGSEALRLRYGMSVKSATIRNEMAAIAEMGYLMQPHTSAGRVPSDLGYRFYVDRLMTPDPLSDIEREQADAIEGLTDAEVDRILHHACRVLSSLTHYTSMATPPKADDVRIKRIHAGLISPGRLLVVTVLNTGEVRHRVLDCGDLSSKQATVLSNFVDSKLSSVRVDAISDAWLGETPGELAGTGDLLKRVVDGVNPGYAGLPRDMVMEGTRHLVRQPEFKDVTRLEIVLDALEDRQAVLGVLTSALANNQVAVVIGSENPYDSVQHCSFVAARYGVGSGYVGTIGVIGPTRMAYEHAIPAVDYVATSLSGLLTRLVLG